MQAVDSDQDSLSGYLVSMGYKPYGNLSALSEEDRQLTRECIDYLLQLRQKDAQTRENYMDMLQTLESEKKSLARQLDYANDRIDILTGDLNRSEAKFRLETSKLRSENSKLALDISDLKKECSKLTGSKDQLLHEIKKLEQNISKLQEIVRKGSDTATNAKNSMDVCAGAVVVMGGSGGAAAEFASFCKRNYEDTLSALSLELDSLRSSVSLLYSGLQLRVTRLQAIDDLPDSVKSFDFPAIRLNTENGGKILMEKTLELVDLLLGPEIRVNEETENDESGVKTLKEARKKLGNGEVGLQKEVIEMQEQVMEAVMRDKAQEKVLQTEVCTPAFQQLLSSHFP